MRLLFFHLDYLDSNLSPWNVTRMGWGDILSLLNVGPKFRKHRRIIQDQFSAKQLSQYAPMQRMEAYATLADLGKTPDDLMRHLKRLASGAISTPDLSDPD